MPAVTAPLLEQLRREALETSRERVDSAQAEAGRIRAEAQERAARRRRAAVTEAERARTRELDSACATTAQRVSHDTLTARAAVLDRVFAAAEARLGMLAAHPGLPALLRNTFEDTLTYMPEGPITVRCPAAVAAAAREAIGAAGHGGVVVREDDSVPLGIIVEAADGSLAVDRTFARALERERPRLAIALLPKLGVPSA